MTNYSTITHKYAFLWNKYRPAILKLMIDSENEPQAYKFSKHEFHNVNAKEKGGYSFVLSVFDSKPVNDIRTSALAKDLLVILQNSNKASELTQTSTYEFTMDKQFTLHIVKKEAVLTEEEVVTTDAE
ncbi:hypothetical protein [Reichenbachiella sp. MALMAid0571]|uniref:hypothetical protein n=1 Tax=Reichenbachiella sp. MALMAid0571 TaxID=3143939 RepID=UPI0032DE6E48